MDEIDDIMATIAEAQRRAADVALRWFRTGVAADIKADDSPVTRADREAEASIRALIAERFPHHAIYGEEQGASAGTGGTWVIDPIDGTKSFLFGNPLFGSLIGFVRDGETLAGGLAMPALGETWIADRRGPTTRDGAPCRVSGRTELAEACLLTSSPDFFTGEEYARFEALSARVRYRRFGGDCYCYAMLAAGWADLVVESALHPYDYLPLVPIIEQAGGVVTDWSGAALTLDSGPRVVAAATRELHAAALETLAA